jgi:hypothetical protein
VTDTLVLTRSEVAALLDPRALLGALRDAFVAYSTRRSVDALRVPVPSPPGEPPHRRGGVGPAFPATREDNARAAPGPASVQGRRPGAAPGGGTGAAGGR